MMSQTFRVGQSQIRMPGTIGQPQPAFIIPNHPLEAGFRPSIQLRPGADGLAARCTRYASPAGVSTSSP